MPVTVQESTFRKLESDGRESASATSRAAMRTRSALARQRVQVRREQFAAGERQARQARIRGPAPRHGRLDHRAAVVAGRWSRCDRAGGRSTPARLASTNHGVGEAHDFVDRVAHVDDRHAAVRRAGARCSTGSRPCAPRRARRAARPSAAAGGSRAARGRWRRAASRRRKGGAAGARAAARGRAARRSALEVGTALGSRA